MSAGIYKIACTRPDGTEKFYYGQTACFRNRKRSHWGCLRRGDHRNSHMQRAWAKYGEGAFSFEVVEEAESQLERDRLENEYLDRFWGQGGCMNLDMRARGAGKISSETRALMSKAKSGRPLSEEHRRKMSEAHLGKKKSDAHLRRLAESNSLDCAEAIERRLRTMGGSTPLSSLLSALVRSHVYSNTFRTRREVFSELRAMIGRGVVRIEPGRMYRGKRSIRVVLAGA